MTVYLFCAVLTKVNRLHKKLLKRAVELHRKLRKVLQSLDNYVAYHHLKFFGKCPVWNLYLSAAHFWYSQWTWES
jgi:hypothetical protein